MRLETVRAIWRELLETSEFGDETHFFFDAGGDSLLLSTLVEELSKACGCMLNVMAVLRAGTVSAQAELLVPKAPGPAQNAE